MGSVGGSSSSSSGADKNDDTKKSTSSSSKSSTSQTSSSSQKSEPSKTGSSVSFNDVMAEATGARAAGPPGIGAPPSTSSTSSGSTSFGDTTPNYTGPVNDPRGPALGSGNENDSTRAAGPPGIAAPPSTPETSDPGLTPEQSEALAQSAAVMSGSTFAPGSIPSTADLALAGMYSRAGGPMTTEPPEEEGVIERAGEAVVKTGEMLAGIGVGAVTQAKDAVIGTADLAWEGVTAAAETPAALANMATSQVGFETFPGAEERFWSRGEAIERFVTSIPELPGQVADSAKAGWQTFEQNWEAGNAYEAGKQIGSLGFEVATVAVPVAKAGALSKAGKVEDATALGARYNTLGAQGHGVARHGPHLSPLDLENRAVHGIDPMTGGRLDGEFSTFDNPVAHFAPRTATSFTSVDAFVRSDQYIRSTQQYRDLRDATVVNGPENAFRGDQKFVVEAPLEEVLGPDYLDHTRGQTRVGSTKNPQGSVPTDLTDGSVRAVFKLDSGSEPRLITLHPVPKK